MLTIALAAALFATPQPGKLATYRDWIVGCDNGRACQAVALLPAISMEGATLAVERGAAADAVPLIWVTLRNEGAELLAMDAQQRRVGTTSALVRRGPNPVAVIAPPPALPVVREVRPIRSAPVPRVAAARAAKLRKAGQCDPDLATADFAQEAYRLDDRTGLVLLRCWQGAYNGTSLVLITRVRDGGDARPAIFDYEATAGERRGFDVPPDGAYWNAETKRLESYFKGRGLGDCGSTQEWAWDGGRFRLIEQTVMGECRGSTDYITTWRARVVPAR